jgi:regulator of sigma E protease
MTFQGLFFWVVAIAATLLVLGVLVLAHEFGHFITARIAGIRVLEFGIGFPPRARVLGRDRHETEYTLNYLPIGGFVKLEGEEVDSDDPRSFVNAGLAKQLFVLVAGVTMNLLIAFALFFVVALCFSPAVGVKADYILAGGAAEAVGLRPGVTIESLNGERFGFMSSQSILEALRAHAGETVQIGYADLDGVHKTVQVTLGTSVEKGVLGIGCSPGGKSACTWGQEITYSQTNPLNAAGLALDQTGNSLRLVLVGLGDLASNLISHPGEAPPGVSGPVGITQVVGVVLLDYGLVLVLLLAAVLSANLALVNILPFPPLDGGKIAIMVAKRIAGKRGVSAVEATSYLVGFALLLAFIAWISFFDIARLIGGS